MKREKETKQPSKPTAQADEGEYKPTLAEADAMNAYFAARRDRNTGTIDARTAAILARR